jgi:hypothetical protein
MEAESTCSPRLETGLFRIKGLGGEGSLEIRSPTFLGIPPRVCHMASIVSFFSQIRMQFLKRFQVFFST